MIEIDARKAGFEAELDATLQEIAFPAEIERKVADMLAAIRREGDAAISRFARDIDGVELGPADFRVSEAEIQAAVSSLSERERQAIQVAFENVCTFARQRLPRDWQSEPRPGVTLGERFHPLTRVAAYLPGGNAPLVSTVIHTLAMAHVAGVEQLVAATPCGPGGRVNPAILAAMDVVGCREVYRLGGVYGIGALAFGTESIAKVDKIVGPGNAWVTAAKRQVYGYVALDMVAGPSEVLVIADDSAPPHFVAADMLAQAEHGSGYERAFLVSTSDDVIAGVKAELASQSAALDDPSAVNKVMDRGIIMVRAQDETQAVELANRIAPEHLEVMTADPVATAAGLNAAGAIFLGPWTPEPIGDFVAGPSHVLPTVSTARYFSGLTVDQFYRRSSTIQYTQDALQVDGPHALTFAEMEALQAHGRSVQIRFDRPDA